jgi:hypothetical protein
MPASTVNPFSRSATHWRPPVPPPEGIRYVIRLDTSCHAAGFGLLLVATLVASFLYLSELVRIARHDMLYGALLVSVWAGYFASGLLLRTRLLGPALACASQVLAALAPALVFGFVYWLILVH